MTYQFLLHQTRILNIHALHTNAGAKTVLRQSLDEEVLNYQNVVAVSHDGSSFALGNNGVRLVDVDSGKQIHYMPQSDSVHALRFAPDGRLVASGDCEGKIHLMDIDSGQQIGPSLIGHSDHFVLPIIRELQFSQDSKYLISLGEDEKLLRWEVTAEAWDSIARKTLGHLE